MTNVVYNSLISSIWIWGYGKRSQIRIIQAFQPIDLRRVASVPRYTCRTIRVKFHSQPFSLSDFFRFFPRKSSASPETVSGVVKI